MNFQTFWIEYPKKVARVAAEKAAKKISEDEWPLVMDGLRKYKKVWSEKQYIPNPATFLNGRRFEDEIETIEETKKSTAASIFINAVRNNRSFPGNELPRDIIITFNKIGIHWDQIKKMSDEEITNKFNQHYGERPSNPISNVVEFKKAASGDVE